MNSEALRTKIATEICEHLPAVIDHKKLRILVEGLIATIDEGTLDNPADTAVGNYQPLRRAMLGFAAGRLTATGLFPNVSADPIDPLSLVMADATEIAGCYLNECS